MLGMTASVAAMPFAFTDRCRCSPKEGIGKGSTGGVESRGALPLLSDRVRRSSATEEEVAPTTTDSRQE